MENNNKNPRKDKPNQEGDRGKHIGTAVIISLALILLFTWVYNTISDSQYTQTTYYDFLEAKETGNLSEVEVSHDRILYMTKEEAAKEPSQQRACYTGLPIGIDADALLQELHDMGVKGDQKILEDNSMILSILYYAMMFAILFFFMRSLTKRMGGDGMMGGFGKSKAKVYMEKQTGVTFRDVAGQDEAKESLQEIIDFLHNPGKYTAIGSRCSLLLHLRFRFRGDVCGYGRKPCP